MMKKVYSVYDKAVEAFLPPFMARTHGEAMRMFMESVKQNEHFSAHVRDYALYWLSEFNDLTGEYGVAEEHRLAVPQLILSGFDALAVMSKEAANPELNGRLAPPRVPRSESVDAESP